VEAEGKQVSMVRMGAQLWEARSGHGLGVYTGRGHTREEALAALRRSMSDVDEVARRG